MSRIEDRKSNDTSISLTLVTGIPESTVIPGTFAFGDLTRFAQLFIFIQEFVVLGPTQDEACTAHKDLGQPGIASEAAIPDMYHVLTPALIHLIEDLRFFHAS